MTRATFFAARDDLVDVFRFVYTETDCRVFETYSRFDEKRREFPDLEAIASLRELGEGTGLQLGLWSPASGPKPVERRVDLNPGAVPGHTHRYVTEGCSIITLQCGGVRLDTLEATHMVWWTKASALKKAHPELGAHSVDWPVLGGLARRIRAHIDRRLSRARANRLPVLGHAADLARQGVRLRSSAQPAAHFPLDTA